MQRDAFVGEYAALTVAAARTGTKIFFADETHFQGEANRRELVDSTSSRRGEKVS